MFKYLACCILLILSSCTNISSNPEINQTDTLDMQIFEAKNGFDIFYDSGATRSIQEYYTSGTVILNGSYFGGTMPGQYYPAGLWIDHTVEKYPLQFDDPNLSHVVAQCADRLLIVDTVTWKNNPCKSPDFAFQAGPLVLYGNILQNFGTSWHANGSHERTLIGITQSGKIYFFISTKPVSLTQIGEKVLQDSRFSIDPITVLNLDGGPSTAYYTRQSGFNNKKNLPIIFRIY